MTAARAWICVRSTFFPLKSTTRVNMRVAMNDGINNTNGADGGERRRRAFCVERRHCADLFFVSRTGHSDVPPIAPRNPLKRSKTAMGGYSAKLA